MEIAGSFRGGNVASRERFFDAKTIDPSLNNRDDIRQPWEVQVMTGHSSIKMTMDTYGHLWKDDAADQALAIAIEKRLSI